MEEFWEKYGKPLIYQDLGEIEFCFLCGDIKERINGLLICPNCKK